MGDALDVYLAFTNYISKSKYMFLFLRMILNGLTIGDSH